MPTISVVITCYNYSQYLTEAIESVLSQTWQDYEIIVIDDGSTDGTSSVMKKYEDKPQVRYIYQKNQGQPKAKNRGIAESRGEFVAFLDADDVWLPDKLHLQLQLFADSDVGVVYSRRYWIDPTGTIIDGNERTLRRGNILDHIFVDNFICFSSSIVRRNMLVAVNGFDESLPMGIDYDLWIRLAVLSRFDFVDKPLVKYRTGHANLSQNKVRRYNCAEMIMERHLADPVVRKKMSWWVPRYAWADTWMNKAYYARKNGDFRLARSLYAKAIMMYPFFMHAWLGLLCSLCHKR